MNKKHFLPKALICLVVFALLLGNAIFLAVRPISYNMEYYGESNDQYGFFAGHRYYTRDNYEIVVNTNFDLPIVGFYYYKDGYIFSLRAETEEQYAQEAENINSNWDEALETVFYATEIDAYHILYVRPDGAEIVYTCSSAIALTAVSAVLALSAAGLSCMYFVLYKKAKKQETADVE